MATIVCMKGLYRFDQTVGPFPTQFWIANHKEVDAVKEMPIYALELYASERRSPKDRRRRKRRGKGVKAYLKSLSERYKRFRRGPSETLAGSAVSSRNACAA